MTRKGGARQGKVALISGGGSGHEPLHAGFVGHGMLDAACPGQVFTSPTPDQMLAAAEAVDGGAGVLFIVKNYAGDVMNFEMAARDADRRASRRSSTNDDVAVETSTYTTGPARRRRHDDRREDRGRRGEQRRRSRRAARRWATASTSATALDGRGADKLHRAGGGQADLRRSAMTRWRWASASTASRAAAASSSAGRRHRRAR